jgi:hypothetical protein
VAVDESGLTTFTARPGGRDRYLVLDEAQRLRILEALMLLSSQPPEAIAVTDSNPAEE